MPPVTIPLARKEAYFYAELDASAKVKSISRLKGPVDAANLIPVADYDETLLGKVYTGEQFIVDPAEKPAPKPKPAEAIAAAGINWAELQTTDLGRAVTLLVSLFSGVPVDDLAAGKLPAGEGETP